MTPSVQRQVATFQAYSGLKASMLYWCRQFDTCLLLDSNERHKDPYGRYDVLIATGTASELAMSAGTAFEQLKEQLNATPDWWFGYCAYDLKNEVEDLSSSRLDGIGLPDLYFFQPETVIEWQGETVRISTLHTAPAKVWQQIAETPVAAAPTQPVAIQLQPRIPKQVYLDTVEKIRAHIAGGDIYEMNFCQEFFAEGIDIQPFELFHRLNTVANTPFAAFFRYRDCYLLSASPERFLQKTGRQLITQPIKGTRKRGATPHEDDLIKSELIANQKDRSENIMIVDLVRNDLSRNCLPGTVVVPELCGIHSFETVHQMISTVTGILPETVHPVDALRDCFPMGSMTGAPKVMAMKLIEQYEHTRRGLYSGAVGYFTPELDFDFNVVIRSLIYQQTRQYLSCQVGGAIVFDSTPEQEYEECLVKLSGIRKVLGE